MRQETKPPVRVVENIPTKQLRTSINEFKVNTEAAFHKLSSDISTYGRADSFTTDPGERLSVFEGLQEQLRNIRNSFHEFNFGLDKPLVPSDENESDDAINHTTEYDRDPLKTAEENLRSSRKTTVRK